MKQQQFLKALSEPTIESASSRHTRDSFVLRQLARARVYMKNRIPNIVGNTKKILYNRLQS